MDPVTFSVIYTTYAIATFYLLHKHDRDMVRT